MELAGEWRATPASDLGRRSFPDPDLDDSAWAAVQVPGHWRRWPGFGSADGPVFHRLRFTAPPPAAGRRAWLRLSGVAYQGDVWLDGSYLGDTEGYFAAHDFEVTDALAGGGAHVLAVEATCPSAADPSRHATLTGALTDPTWVGPAWNPGGIWAPVELVETGAVRMRSVRLRCTDASPDAATLQLDVALDAATSARVGLSVVVRDEAGREVARRDGEEAVAVGDNRVGRRLRIERPALWWPHAMGDQPLHTVEVAVDDDQGRRSDARTLTTGLRQVRTHHLVTSVNGERLHLKGATYGPTSLALAEGAATAAADVAAAVGAGLDLLRVRAHVAHPSLYAAADAAGLLLWQDMPITGGGSGLRRQAVRQARQAVALLGHHPSVAIWCGHDEPAPGGAPQSLLRRAARQAVPRPAGVRLERSVRRALERADGSRPVLASSGALPHPAGATDAELWPGWRSPDQRDLPTLLRRLPVLARFVTGLSAQSAPADGSGLPGCWPDLDWAALAAAGTDLELLAPPSSTYAAWAAATQARQAELVARSVLDLRRLKYRPGGGFTVATMVDAHPAVSAALLDNERRPKAAWAALAEACAPVVVVADRLPATVPAGGRLRVSVHVVSDLRSHIDEAACSATVRWPGGERRWRFTGPVPADAVARIGVLELTVPEVDGELELLLDLRWPGGTSAGSDAARVERAAVELG